MPLNEPYWLVELGQGSWTRSHFEGESSHSWTAPAWTTVRGPPLSLMSQMPDFITAFVLSLEALRFLYLLNSTVLMARVVPEENAKLCWIISQKVVNQFTLELCLSFNFEDCLSPWWSNPERKDNCRGDKMKNATRAQSEIGKGIWGGRSDSKRHFESQTSTL